MYKLYLQYIFKPFYYLFKSVYAFPNNVAKAYVRWHDSITYITIGAFLLVSLCVFIGFSLSGEEKYSFSIEPELQKQLDDIKSSNKLTDKQEAYIEVAINDFAKKNYIVNALDHTNAAITTLWYGPLILYTFLEVILFFMVTVATYKKMPGLRQFHEPEFVYKIIGLRDTGV